MHVDVLTWGAWSVAILAIAGVLVLLSKVVRFVFRLARRAGKFFDQWFGDREAGVPSMPERMAQVTDQLMQQGHRLDEHLTWHSAGDRANGAVPTKRPGRTP
jgi:hypothetical protein